MAGAQIYQRIEAVNRAQLPSLWMSIRLVAMDVDLKGGVMLRFDWTSFHYADTLDCYHFPFSIPHTEALV